MRRKSSATTRTKLTQPILRVLFRASFLSFSQCRFSFRFQFRFLNRFPEARVRKFLLSGLRRVRGVVARLLQLSPLVLLSERDRFGIFFWETGGEAVAHLFVFFSSSNIRGGCFFMCSYSRRGERDVRERDQNERPKHGRSFFLSFPILTRKREQSNTTTNAAFEDRRVFLDEEAIRRARDLFFLVCFFLVVVFSGVVETFSKFPDESERRRTTPTRERRRCEPFSS